MANRFNTGNPRSSNNMKDLNDNAVALDEFLNDKSHSTFDRLGENIPTLRGIIDRVNNNVGNALQKIGYEPVDSFEDGYILTSVSQALRLKSNNAFYSWRGEYPKVVPTGSTPETTGGFASNAWVDVNDLTLRSELKSASGARLVKRGMATIDDIIAIHVKQFGAHDVNEPGFENFDSAPAFQAAIDYAQANNIKTVNVTGNYKLLSAQGGEYTLPRDDGRISEYFAARGEVPINPEPVITMPVCISMPSYMCLKADNAADSSLYGSWGRASSPIDTGQMVGICLRHRGWPNSNDRLTAYVQEVKTSNVKIGGFLLGIVSDGIVYSKCQFNNLSVSNCGIPIVFQGCDNVQFTGSTELVTNLAAMVIGGQWLQRENAWWGGKWTPPYIEGRDPDIASVGWCDMFSIDRLSVSYGGQPFGKRHLDIDKFFNDYFYKSFNNTARLTKTDREGVASNLDKIEPYRGISHRAFVNYSRYCRGNSDIHIYEVKIFACARTPFFSPHTQGADYYGTVHAGFYENVGSWDANKYTVATDHYAKGNDTYNADRQLVKFGVVEGVMGIGRVTYAGSVQCIAAENARIAYDRRQR